MKNYEVYDIETFKLSVQDHPQKTSEKNIDFQTFLPLTPTNKSYATLLFIVYFKGFVLTKNWSCSNKESKHFDSIKLLPRHVTINYLKLNTIQRTPSRIGFICELLFISYFISIAYFISFL